MAAPGVLHWGYPQGTGKGAASRTLGCLLPAFRPDAASATLTCVMARDRDRDVRRPSRGGLFERSIYPVERNAGVWDVGRTDPGAEHRPHTRRDFLHERVGDALHALSREPDGRADTLARARL
jgi:hypothetical protein